MASIYDDPIARLLFGAGGAGEGVSLLQGATLTAWDGVTYACTVTAGTAVYTDIPVLNPTTLVLGRVLLGFGPAGPVILGPLYQKTPPAPPEP